MRQNDGGRRATVRVSRDICRRLDLFSETIETVLSLLHQHKRVTLVSKMPELTMLHMPADVS